MHPKDRKDIKKENLKDAKSHFPFKAKLNVSLLRSDLIDWFIRNRLRSWKQKGIDGDYYTKDHVVFWFKTEEIRTFFIMTFK